MYAAQRETFGALVASPPLMHFHNAFPYAPEAAPSCRADVQPVNQAKVYSKEDWEARKAMIEQLYATGTLETTRLALREDGFPVTIKQLKRKVMGWGLRKNLKKAEREALVRQQAHVNATGGERVFALDNPLNKVITTARMERMFKRDGIAIEQSADLIPATPPDVIYKTVPVDMTATIAIRNRPCLTSIVHLVDDEPPVSGDTFNEKANSAPMNSLPLDEPLLTDRFDLGEPSFGIESPPLAEPGPGNGLLPITEQVPNDVLLPEDVLLHEYKITRDDGPVLMHDLHPADKFLSDNSLDHKVNIPFSGTISCNGSGPDCSDVLALADRPLVNNEANPSIEAHRNDCLVGPSFQNEHPLNGDMDSAEDFMSVDGELFANKPAFQTPTTPDVVELLADEAPKAEELNEPESTSQLDENSTTNSHVVLSKRPKAQRTAGQSVSLEQAHARARKLAKLRKAFSDTLTAIGLADEENESPKTGSKRKSSTILFYQGATMQTPEGRMCGDTNYLQFRASARDCKRLYAFGFRPVRQIDDSISMILPPLFDKPYLIDEEVQEREHLCEMERLYGSNDRRTLAALINLGSVFDSQYRFSLARNFHHRAGALCRKLFGDGDDSTIDAFTELAATFCSQGNYSEATYLLDQLEKCSAYYFGITSDKTLHIRRKQCFLLLERGDFAAAEAQSRQLIETCNGLTGMVHRNHFHTQIMLALASSLHMQEYLSESKNILIECIRLAEERTEVWSTMAILDTKRRLANVLQDEGATEEGNQLHWAVNKELEILRPGIEPRENFVW